MVLVVQPPLRRILAWWSYKQSWKIPMTVPGHSPSEKARAVVGGSSDREGDLHVASHVVTFPLLDKLVVGNRHGILRRPLSLRGAWLFEPVFA